MFGLGPLEIGVIILMAFLIFGTRLPKIAWGIGKSIVNFKKGIREISVADNVQEAPK